MKKAIIHMEYGDIVIELFEKEAPGTVANFVKLIKEGFYDTLKFHRVIPGFVAQGGCPMGTGVGGPGYTIPCETKGNPHKHHLDGVHTVFGQVIEGMDVVDKIQQGDRMQTVEVVED